MGESFEHILRQGASISSGDIRALAQWWESIATERARKDAEIARLKRDGVKVTEEIHRWGTMRAAMIEGPDLAAIELVEVRQ